MKAKVYLLIFLCMAFSSLANADTFINQPDNSGISYTLTLNDVTLGNKKSLKPMFWPSPEVFEDFDKDGFKEGVCFWEDYKDGVLYLIAEFWKGDSNCVASEEITLFNLENSDNKDLIQVSTYDFDKDGSPEFVLGIKDFRDDFTRFAVIKLNGKGINPCDSGLTGFFKLVGSGEGWECFIHDDSISGRNSFTGHSYSEWIYRNGSLKELSD